MPLACLRDRLALRIPRALAESDCRRWVSGVYAGRAAWTPCFDAVQFTLGRAWYTHLEEGRTADYFARARGSDATVDRYAPGLQSWMHAMVRELVGAEVVRRAAWCGPGVHIFPHGGWLADRGGDVHFDLEGLSALQREQRAPALTLVLMLQPPVAGGGLVLWDRVFDGTDESPGDAHSERLRSQAGDLVVLDSYRLHQIEPFAGPIDRISATAHAVRDGDRWEIWF